MVIKWGENTSNLFPSNAANFYIAPVNNRGRTFRKWATQIRLAVCITKGPQISEPYLL